ncbi:uncharacterized protein Z518_03190 [Rhinocladiella mackenziei CBS 650.93]|uniref:NAD-dependent epimerase/dehydratase domain-containing protein n=1 Tax=Rhinocladiella mackenziei CBS 650.93 TaxID=1442369 RepID=A0A0D2IRF9_9EURO|nr:uncharacterized protein Z518_03190 [Rhinocladiella mackenziei CBS 650.93]KIX08534.1 hypothetical protein Z518_03190 [Rhinocladiella mackenziei CBS 650.93]
MSSLVLLTGPNGFVGAHVLEHLLRSHFRVRGTVRSLSKATYLQNKYAAASSNGDLAFVVVPDIQAPGALDSAAQGVDYICHVASPYFTSSNDPIKELVEPAVNGTRNVVSSALKTKTLKKMTVLSSFASVVDLSKNPRGGYTYTSDDWDPVTMEEAAKDGYMGYHASKTFAERTAWEVWKDAKAKGEITWDLVTFCPPMIYGPPVQEIHQENGVEGLNTSIKRLITSIQGQDPNFKPKVATPGLPAWVDVRDVAEAHVRALTMLEKGVSERFLLCGGVDYFEDGLAGLRARGEKGLGEEGVHVVPGEHFGLDRSKAEKMLKLEFTPFQKTVEDSWEASEDEWKLEQGLTGAELPIRDQTLLEGDIPQSAILSDEENSEDDYDPDILFAEEWREYIEWEDYPGKKAVVHQIMLSHTFSPRPEFQLGPISDANPIFKGVRWKQRHQAICSPLTSVPEESWLRVIQEKHPTAAPAASSRSKCTQAKGTKWINTPWANGGINTAHYAGVSLKKVIKQCGGMAKAGKHLEFHGADTYFDKMTVMNLSCPCFPGQKS